jgi:single-strand DNA-binding protein
MFSLNRAQILGNLTRDPEVKTLPSGQTVTSFAVATNRRWKDKDGNTKEDTQYHEITVWGRLGELASQMLSKGKKVYVEGRLQTNSWEGSDGAKRSRTEIIGESFIPLSPKDGTGFEMRDKSIPKEQDIPKTDQSTDTKSDKKTQTTETAEEINLDDIPF